ncbi:MAG: DUF2971 domain-containing protein [Pseudomonadota bacterium]
MPIKLSVRAPRTVKFNSNLRLEDIISRLPNNGSDFKFLTKGVLAECTPDDAQSVLYHYTDPFGLEGIAKSGELWASPSSTLNDGSETTILLDALRAAINEKRSNLIKNGVFSELEAQRCRRLENYLNATVGEVFVLSMTEKHDQLSQWRAYAKNGVGYSLGIPTVALMQAAKSQGFAMVRCCYERTQCVELARKLVDGIFDLVPEDELLEKSKPVPVLNAWSRLIKNIAPCFKHNGFEEEKEWRVFRIADYADDRIKSRATIGGIINYTTLEWASHAAREGGMEKGEKVVVYSGPGVRSSRGVENIFRLHGLSVGLGASQIPYLG